MQRERRGLEGIALCAVLVLLATTSVRAQGSEGVLEGRIVNGTEGGAVPGAGLTVLLVAVKDDAEVGRLETTSDDSGHFRFTGLDTDASLSYYAQVWYLGVVYESDEALQFGAGQPALATTLTVYETTEDDAAVNLVSVHMIVDTFGQVLRIREIHLLGNSGDRTYVGRSDSPISARRTTVSIPLPADAVGLSIEDEQASERFIQTDDGLVDTQPVVPGMGTVSVVFSYHLMVTGSSVPLERRFALPVGSLSVLLAQPGLDLRSEQLSPGGSFQVAGRDLLEYGTEDLPANTPVKVNLLVEAEPAAAQMPTASAQVGGAARAAGSQGLVRGVGFALALLAPLVVVVYAASGRASGAGREPVEWLVSEAKARQALRELAEYQQALEAGTIDEAEYERVLASSRALLQTLWE